MGNPALKISRPLSPANPPAGSPTVSPIASKLPPRPAPPRAFYDGDYFDSDDDSDDPEATTIGNSTPSLTPPAPTSNAPATITNDQLPTQSSKSQKGRPIPSNDTLLYDPDADSEDEKWAASNHPATNSLSCPYCLTTFCTDFQRHETYSGQFRAMFYVDCVVGDEVERNGGEDVRVVVSQLKPKSMTAPLANWSLTSHYIDLSPKQKAVLVPAPRGPYNDPKSFLTAIGRGCDVYADKFTSWDHLFTATAEAMETDMGVKVAQRKYILGWRDWFRRGIDPYEVKIPVRQKKYLKERAKVNLARLKRQGLA
ncbi:hypothetical protein HKX48_001680 [Thoreauomyces humboldtii]|nr:hypothetical protein HKX48_001680 [Thoreauomyces humboldtii]